ncbi:MULTISPECIES: hypothetical protein [Thermodesulfovibrio]|jgi:hypothetical protein|uniref:hypothetical protein n=1 Tax=Thermodesulfovibrio TaxID=28261 RepID=UPI0026344C7E|nr:hypothetical protein [Thermodesulfovibrio sp.]
MKTLFIEGDLKNAYAEVVKAVDEAKENLISACGLLSSLSRSISGKTNKAIEDFQEAKAILEEMRDFTDDDYNKALIDELIEDFNVKAVTLKNLSIYFHNSVKFVSSQIKELVSDSCSDVC